MLFSRITNAALSREADRPLMQKETYPVLAPLQQYLRHYGRDVVLPVSYAGLLHYRYTDSIKDEDGKHTHWERVEYSKEMVSQLHPKLVAAYALLKNRAVKDIEIKTIDFCEFANSMPFRVSVVDTRLHSNDIFYIKSADASRIYGLELEQLLSPNDTVFLNHGDTLIEEHIDGTPGDAFLKETEGMPEACKREIAEAFVRFNERCFVRLLGDMRSYNYVVRQQYQGAAFHIRAIDFDQQCYEGKMNLYLPQFYKENYGYVQMVLGTMDSTTIEEIRTDERKNIRARARKHPARLEDLLRVMGTEEISGNYKVLQLRKELGAWHKTLDFDHCKTMGAIVKQQLHQLLPAI